MPDPGDGEGEFSGVTEQDFERAMGVVRKLVEALATCPSSDVLLGLQLMFARECVLGGLQVQDAVKILSTNVPKFIAFWEQVRKSPESLS